MNDINIDFDNLRKRMVEGQLVTRGIKNKRVLEAFYKVPRHRFVLEKIRDSSYNDCPLPIGNNQTISQPYIVALMTERLNISGKEKVLEIGTGSGYQTAILAELAKEVYSIERIPSLAQEAKDILEELGYKNITIKIDDGCLGWEEFAPYDAIMITAASEYVPPPLLEELGKDGRLVAPIGNIMSQVLTRFTRSKTGIVNEEICGCVFVPLIGKYGAICK
jgi:protein-L-isoaspartate(D-aspartate) O-methyltransferase